MCSRCASKYKSKFCFVSKQACINCICEVKISCKVHLAPFFFFLPGKPILTNFQTAPLCLQSEVSIENITGPVTCDLVGAHVNISPFEECLKI